MADILHWNLKGIKDKRSLNYKEKIEIVTHLLSSPQKNGIINLQETHLGNIDQIPLEWKHFEHIYTMIPNFSTNTDTFAGTLIFIKKSVEIIDVTILVPGRVILVKTRHEGDLRNTNYFFIYGKASGCNTEKTAILHKLLDHCLDPNDLNILIGDYNFVSSPLDRNTNKLNPSDEACKRVWNDIEVRLNLVDGFRDGNIFAIIYYNISK